MLSNIGNNFGQRFAVYCTAIVFSAATLASVITGLKPTQLYSEFIVGSIAWGAQAKFQDLIVAPLLLCVFFVTIWAGSRLFYHPSGPYNDESYNRLASHLIWWSIPAAIAIGPLILNFPTDDNLLYFSAVSIFLLALFCFIEAKRLGSFDSRSISFIIIAVILLLLWPLELGLLLGRIHLLDEAGVLRFLKFGLRLVVVVTLIILVAAIFKPLIIRSWLPKLLALGQVGLPLFFLSLYPASFVTPQGMTRYSTTLGLKLGILGVILFACWDIWHRFQRNREEEFAATVQIFSPIAIFALIVGFKLGVTLAPTIPSDDYHFGEHLLGWWSTIRFGSVPYVDYLPAHGLVDDDFVGLLAFLFYDGTASALPEAGRLAFTVLLVVSFFSLFRFTESLGFAFVVSLLLSGRLAWLYLTPFLCLWLSTPLQAKPSRWLGTWILTVPLVILGVPPQGLLLVAATSPLALWAGWQIWRSDRKALIRLIALMLLLFAVLSLFIPLTGMLMGAVRYVLDNSPINQVAYGIPWEISWHVRDKNSLFGLLFELARMSWIAVPFVALWVLFFQTNKSEERWITIRRMLPILVFSLLIIPYAMGRIDPGSVSRPGILAIWGWTVLIPVMLWAQVPEQLKAIMVLLVAMAASTLGFSDLSLSRLNTTVSPTLHIGSLTEGNIVGLPNVGHAAIQGDHLEHLLRLNQVINKYLSPGETYLDLTGRNAHYFYLNRPAPIAVTAPYNMVPVRQQEQAVARLQNETPRLALFEADNQIHDGGSVSLRTPLLYRFALEKYEPILENGFILGVLKNTVSRQGLLRVSIKDFTDANWDRGIHRHEAAFIVLDPSMLSMLEVGDLVHFPQSGERRIIRIWKEGSAVWVDGSPLNANLEGAPGTIEVAFDAERLLDKPFAVPDLSYIPVSWGRSVNSLSARMRHVVDLDPLPLSMRDMRVDGKSYIVTGNDPQLLFELTGLQLSGRQAGLLKMDFTCHQRRAKPRIQVFWWGDDQTGPSEPASSRFNAENGTLIVPLDAYPRWLTLEKVKGLRIDLDNAEACASISVRNVALFQRAYLFPPGVQK
jgi:hypothetical protein